MIVASLLQSQGVEDWKAGQPSFHIHLVSEADPCMLYREDARRICIIIIYIDDILIIGKEEVIDTVIKVLQSYLQVKDPLSLEDYLGVQIM